jgi:hypothetical protein
LLKLVVLAHVVDYGDHLDYIAVDGPVTEKPMSFGRQPRESTTEIVPRGDDFAVALLG